MNLVGFIKNSLLYLFFIFQFQLNHYWSIIYFLKKVIDLSIMNFLAITYFIYTFFTFKIKIKISIINSYIKSKKRKEKKYVYIFVKMYE